MVITDPWRTFFHNLGTAGKVKSMKSRSMRVMVPGVIAAALLVSACGDSSPEKALEKSRKIPALHDFGTLYVPLWQQAVIDSDWTAIRTNIVEIERLKIPVSRLDCPENRMIQKSDWDTNQRLFVRAVGNLNFVMGYRGAMADSLNIEIAEGVQSVYDWWFEMVDFLR
ncbi:hypothetical protein ACFL3H_06705 [Gemmatimonadota bacterium]